MRTRTIPLLVVTVLAGACVTRAKHDAALRALDDSKAELATTQQSLDTTKAALATSTARATELEQAIAAEQAKLAALAAEKADLEGKLAEAGRQLEDLDAQAKLAQRGLSEVLKRRAGIKAELERVTSAMAQLAARQLAAERRVAEYRDMLGRFRTLIDAGTLDVRIVDGRMVLTLPVDILFPSGSAKLSSDGAKALGQVGVVLATIPGKKFQVEGHTDDVPIHTERFASNWELAAGRALIVVHTLLASGMPPAQLSAASFAEYEPRVENSDDRGRALNRRIEIVLLPDLSGLPGYDELEKLAKP